MSTIQLTTRIKAPIERCFMLSLSVDLHTKSTEGTQERAVAGVTRGIMGLNDTVTWEARHFGIKQKLTTRISAYSSPNYFVSEMVKGAFKKIHHQHIFHRAGEETIMTDIFAFEAPMGLLGRAAEKIFLKNYMEKFLVKRNATIKALAESGEWIDYLKTPG
ncbi:MAG TPA: SRPBCC family protein [Bacteroidia bacterium]|jgi:ligand-binding SRPBCC domain-containing protein